MIVAGIGCRSDCAAEEIVALVQQAMALCGIGVRVGVLATAAHRASLRPVHVAASELGMALLAVTRESLAAEQSRCVTHSERVREATGLGSVAEAAALAASGSGSRLLLPRIASGQVTCAIAVSAP